MDTLPLSCITPEVRRLVSFHRTPLPNDRKLSISNSPAKLARAGFLRRDDAQNDEVTCERCNITYGDWEGESPFAVHRVLSEHCDFLITPSPEAAIQNHPRVVAARRRLFTEDYETDDRSNDSGYDSRLGDSPQPLQPTYVSVLSAEATFTFPFQPRVGNASMLFASRRLKTFTDPGCRLCIKWAEEGFVFKPDTEEVQCVFCAVVFPFDSFDVQQMHADSSALCPRVLMKDVGNITRAEEERIKLKNLQRQLRKKELQQPYAICHPQYEEENVRIGTYEHWPLSSWVEELQPTVLSEAGFYYTGCADKVKCYCCGLGLYTWRQESDPWVQHALHMPSCPHVLSKGQNFIEEAAQAQVLTEADLPPAAPSQGSAGSMGQLVTSAPGSLTMDMSALSAALTTSQYSIADIRQAVLTYFCHTSRFPTKDILLGQLRAADVNFSDLCKQREVLHQKDTVIQEKDTVIQEKDTVIQEKDTVIQEKDTVIQEKDTVIVQKEGQLEQHVQELQHKDQELQHKDQELQFHREVVRNQEAELEQKEAELERQAAELERRRQLMAYQEQQITSLQLQMQALLAHRRQAGQQAAPLQAANNDEAVEPQNTAMTCDIRCKVCLSAESNTIFQPCHHITCCKTCAQQLVNEFCPVCRAPISNVLPAYIS